MYSEEGKNIGEIILMQLGGKRFALMTGTKDFTWDSKKNTLRMTLAKNASKANRLYVTYNSGTDDYTMIFKRVSLPRLNKKTWTYSEYKETDLSKHEGVYCDMLRDIFEQETGLYTTLYPRY